MIKVKDILSLTVGKIGLMNPNGEYLALLTGSSEKMWLLSDKVLDTTVKKMWISDCLDETIIVQL